jgi:hypothetical protein
MEDDETCRDIFGIFKLNKNRIDRSSLCHLGPTPPGSWRRSGAAWTHRWKWNAWEILRTGNRFMTILWHFMNWVHQLIVNLVDVCWYSRVFFSKAFPPLPVPRFRQSWGAHEVQEEGLGPVRGLLGTESTESSESTDWWMLLRFFFQNAKKLL